MSPRIMSWVLRSFCRPGEIVSTGGKTVKGVVGYDVTNLMVGSEGTLGIITKIILSLLPLPKGQAHDAGHFPRLQAAANTVSQIIRSRIIPTTLEFMDNATIRCVEHFSHLGLPVDAGALLIIEVDGRPGALASGESTRLKRFARPTKPWK